MTTENLINFLQEQEGKNILIELEGIITTIISIEQMQIDQEENNLFFKSKENKETKVGFNLNQLMKISKIKENEILLEFDQLQSVKIISM